MNNNIFLWVLYDFANSFLSAALEGLYFSQWVIIEHGFADIWYGGTYAAATLFLLISAPLLGAWSDIIRKRIPFIKWTTLFSVILTMSLGVVATSSISSSPKVLITLVIFFFIQYFYQASLIYYNPLLHQLSTVKTRGAISGVGQVANNFGWLLATGLLLLLVNRNFAFIGQPGRAQVFLPSAILFGLFALPMLLWFKEKTIESDYPVSNTKMIIINPFKSFFTLLKKNKNVALYLVAFMLISDAILTANLFFAIFLDRIYYMADNQKFILLTLMFSITIPGSFIFGKLGDKYGLKKILTVASLLLAISFFVISISTSLNILYLSIIIVGLGWGGYYTSARALLVKISPQQKLGEYFGYYAVFQKFASIIGPLTWGVVTLLLSNYGVVKYRVAVLALVFLMLIGTVLLTKVQEEKVKVN